MSTELAHKTESLETLLLREPQVPTELDHHFAPGIYLRELFVPKGALVVTHQHRTEHFAVVLEGSCKVVTEEGVVTYTSPCLIRTMPGTKRVAYVLEDMRWMTIHATQETDLDKLEELLVVKSASYLDYQKEMEALCLT